MDNETAKAAGTETATKTEHKQTLDEKIVIRLKKCGNLANATQDNPEFLSQLSDSEKKALSVLLKKCLMGRKK